jgi:hypothetical protein
LGKPPKTTLIATCGRAAVRIRLRYSTSKAFCDGAFLIDIEKLLLRKKPVQLSSAQVNGLFGFNFLRGFAGLLIE